MKIKSPENLSTSGFSTYVNGWKTPAEVLIKYPDFINSSLLSIACKIKELPDFAITLNLTATEDGDGDDDVYTVTVEFNAAVVGVDARVIL